MSASICSLAMNDDLRMTKTDSLAAREFAETNKRSIASPVIIQRGKLFEEKGKIQLLVQK
jgi:hypothetical protein